MSVCEQKMMYSLTQVPTPTTMAPLEVMDRQEMLARVEEVSSTVSHWH